MPISIIDPILSTKIIIVLLACVLLITLRQKKDTALFPLAVTHELKGFAILAIIFSHIGYILSVDQRFLFPLSIMAGVGVNLFLFLSGYGLAVSSLKKTSAIDVWYKKRLLKLFMPLWIVILVLFAFDFFFLNSTYPLSYMVQSLLGFFPRADVWLDVNSPLWFITLLLFYYVLFPFMFSNKHPLLSAIMFGILGHLVLKLPLPVDTDVLNLYTLHYVAFPFGIACASLVLPTYNLGRVMLSKIHFPYKHTRPIHAALLIVLLCIIGYTALHSGVGKDPVIEQTISIITMSALLLFFLVKKFEIRAFHFFGFYSYELYLIHWPLMSRYDIFFKRFPGWLAILLYLGLFVLLAWMLQKLVERIYTTNMFK